MRSAKNSNSLNERETEELLEITSEWNGESIEDFIALMRRVHYRWSQEKKTHPVVARIAGEYGIPVTTVLGRSRSRELSEARAEIAHELREQGLTLHEIGAAMNRHHTSVLYLLNKEGS
jgi:chromosomal replication initiation ATPase DnaA